MIPGDVVRIRSADRAAITERTGGAWVVVDISASDDDEFADMAVLRRADDLAGEHLVAVPVEDLT